MSAPIDILAIACQRRGDAAALHEYYKSLSPFPVVGGFEAYIDLKQAEMDLATIRGWVAEWRVANGLPIGA